MIIWLFRTYSTIKWDRLHRSRFPHGSKPLKVPKVLWWVLIGVNTGACPSVDLITMGKSCFPLSLHLSLIYMARQLWAMELGTWSLHLIPTALVLLIFMWMGLLMVPAPLILVRPWAVVWRVMVFWEQIMKIVPTILWSQVVDTLCSFRDWLMMPVFIIGH